MEKNVKKFFPFINALGFSLVETLVALGLLAGVGAGVMTLVKYQSSAVTSMKGKDDLASRISLIKEQITKYPSCTLNFKGQRTGQGRTLDELKVSTSVSAVRVGEDLTRTHRLTRIEIGEHNGVTKRTPIIFSVLNQQGGKRIESRKVISVFSEVDESGVITRCLDPMLLTAENILRGLCGEIDPSGEGSCENSYRALEERVKRIYCASDHPFLEFDNATNKCKPLDAGKRCPAGTYVQGYSETGDLICYMGPAPPEIVLIAAPTTGGSNGGGSSGGNPTPSPTPDPAPECSAPGTAIANMTEDPACNCYVGWATQCTQYGGAGVPSCDPSYVAQQCAIMCATISVPTGAAPCCSGSSSTVSLQVICN